MSDILSQDEIDKLLNAAASGTMPIGGASEPGLEAGTVGHVDKLVSHVFNAANQTIATLIARSASVRAGNGQAGSSTDFDNVKSVAVKAPFRSGFAGSIVFVMEAGAAAVLADLILGGEGEGKTDLAEGDDDAVKEVFGQVLGNAAPMISSSLGVETGFDSATIAVTEPGGLANAVGAEKVYVSKGTLVVEGVLNADLRIVFDSTTANSIAEAIGIEPETYSAPAPSAPSYSQPREAAPAARAYAPAPPPADIRNIDLILDIEVEVMVRLGNAQMPLREIQKLRPGSIIDLDRDTDALVELVVNDRVIAKGELVVVSSDHFALRVTEIVTPTERIRSLGGE